MMRRLIPLATAATLFAFPVLAQNAPSTTTTQAPATSAPATAPAQKAPSHHRMTLQQRFDAANTTHDGKLTKDQAAAANWSYVTRNFAAIDKDKKGYVTVQDIHAFAKARHIAHRKAMPAATQSGKG
jgi:hypothetical protein